MSMTEEQFAEELAHLILRATPCLPAKAMYAILLDEATAQEGEIIKQTWPPDKKD